MGCLCGAVSHHHLSGGPMIDPCRGTPLPPAPLTGPLPLLQTAHSVGCRQCPLAASRTHIVDGVGPYRPQLMIVGEAPGNDEDSSGTPFTGAWGRLLKGTLSELGFPPEHAWLTQSVRCKTPDARVPTPGELGACRQWLELEIEAIKPRAILCLGKVAEQQVAALPPELLADIPVHHAWHPTSILRSPARADAWKDQLRPALGLVPTGVSELPEPRYQEAEPWLSARYLAVDTETDETDADDGGTSRGQQMVCFQVSDGVRSKLYAADDPILEELRRHHVYVQGAKFDLPLLGIDHRNLDAWNDTQLMSYVLREELYGLKPQALKQHNLRIPAIQTLIGSGKKRIPFSQALREQPEKARDYGQRDAFATSLLAESQMRRLEEDPPLLKYYTEIEKPTLAILLDMEQHGVLVDPTALEPLGRLLDAEIKEATRQVQLALGVFNIASGPQLGKALIEAGYILSETTPTGQPKTDEVALLKSVGRHDRADLDPLNHKHELIGAILDIKGKAKLRTTYVTGLQNRLDSDNRIHARFNQCATNTNRLSSSKPNLQNIPVRGPIKKTLRRIFVAPPGHMLVKADYSQLEVRIYAHYTHEPVLLDAYRHRDHDAEGPLDGRGAPTCIRCDVHQQVAHALKIPRFRAKNVLFGAIYGASFSKLAVTAGIPSEESLAFLAQMRLRLPSLLTWQAQCSARLGSQGYLETLLGWRGYFPHYWSPEPRVRRAASREAANFPIQGSAAGLVKRLMILADEGLCAYDAAHLVLQVHDEVVYEVPTAEARTFAHDLEELGAAVGELAGLAVPLKLDVGVGPTWGDLTDWREWEPT